MAERMTPVTAPQSLLSSSAMRSIGAAVLVGLGYFLLARLSLFFVAQPQGVAVLWLPAGFFLGILLTVKRRNWPPYVLAAMIAVWLAHRMAGDGPLVSLGFAAAHCAESVAGAWALVRFAGRDVRVDTPRGLVMLTLVVVLGSNALTALGGAAVVALSTGAPFLEVWQLWRIADGVGIMIITPLILTWREAITPAQAQLSWRRAIEIVVVAGGVTASTILVFTVPGNRTYLIFPLMLWAAMRFGSGGATLAMTAVATIAVRFTLAGSGPFADTGRSNFDNLLDLQIFLSITAFSVLLLAAAIGERGRAEGARSESEARFRSIFEASPIGIVVVDLDARAVAVNPALARMFGYSVEEMIGKKGYDLTHPDDVKESRRAIGRLVRGEEKSITLEKRFLARDGNDFWAIMTTTMIYDPQGRPLYHVSLIQDITQRKEIEDALKGSERRYRSTLDSMMEGFQIISFDWRYLYVNEAAARQGRRARVELLGKTMMEMYPGIENSELFVSLRQCIAEQVPASLENQFTFPDGSTGWFELKIQPVEEGVVILSNDISERKRAEEALRGSEQKFSLLFEKAPFAATLSSPSNGVILEVNEAFETVFGYTREEAVGKTSAELGINPDAEARSRILALLEEQGSARNVEMTLRTKSGAMRTMSVNLNLVDVGPQKYILNMTQDITERKRAEAALRSSENRLHGLIETAPSAIIAVDMEGRIRVVNNATEAMFGWRRGELLGKKVEVLLPKALRRAHVRDRQDFMENPEARTMGRGRDLHGVKKDGATFPIEVGLSYAAGEGGGIVTAFVVDITERKRAEEAVYASQENLRQISAQLHELTIRLTQTQEDERRMVATELHDTVGQLLTVARMRLRLLDRALEPQARLATQAQVDSLNEIIEDALTQVRAISHELRPPLLDEMGWQAALAWLCQSLADRSGQRIDYNHTGEIIRLRPEIEMSAYRVTQEALTNAMRHASAKEIRVQTYLAGGDLAVIIEDDGRGFDPIGVRRADQPDHGLGLLSMRERAEVAGGQVELTSEPGRGTRVEAHFPAVRVEKLQ